MATRARALLRTLLDARAIAGLALVVALTGVTPADAVRATKQALFASNAGAVNGIKASRTPHPKRLLPLGADGHFPASVLPSNNVRGPRGAEGPAGPRGPSDARIVSNNEILTLSTHSGVPTQVAALDGLAPGSYLVQFNGVAHFRQPETYLVVTCETRVNGNGVKLTRAILGERAAASGEIPLSSQVPVVLADRSNVTVACWPDASPVEAPLIIFPSLSALSVANLTVG